MKTRYESIKKVSLKTLNSLDDFIKEDLVRVVKETKHINITDALVVKSCFKAGFSIRLSAVSDIVTFLKKQ